MRYALLIGSPADLSVNNVKLSGQKINGTLKRWQKALADINENPFKGAEGEAPDILYPLTEKALIDQLSKYDLKADPEILIYYFGHSYPTKSGNVAFGFAGANFGELEQLNVSWLIDRFFAKGFARVILIVDSCHVGDFAFKLHEKSDKLYCMYGSTGYSYMEQGFGVFSDCLLDGLSVQSDSRTDRRIDRIRKVMTYTRWFEYARYNVSTRIKNQIPVDFGNIGSLPIISLPRKTDEGFNDFSPNNSIYRKLYCLISIIMKLQIGNEGTTLDYIVSESHTKSEFVIEETELGSRYVSAARLLELIEFLAFLNFVKIKYSQKSTNFLLTSDGLEALNKSVFNKKLLDGFEKHVLPEGVDVPKLKSIAADLLKEGFLPNAYNIGTEIERQGLKIKNKWAFKMMFSTLGYAREFHKTTYDTIFPVLRIKGYSIRTHA